MEDNEGFVESGDAPVSPAVQHILDVLAETNPEAILYDGFNEALIGLAEHWAPSDNGKGASHTLVALYDYGKCVEILMDRDGISLEDAQEHMDFNVTGGYVGCETPVFAHTVTAD